jgi:hypothetical protein
VERAVQERGQGQHTIESMHADFAVGPVEQRRASPGKKTLPAQFAITY